ncbi:MAG: NAD(P)H-binding protein [Candidatus Dormibacteraeota bacterium]|nr:NAD(P)H-binding protein [Candidatus Dormibacteraeota bacterium]
MMEPILVTGGTGRLGRRTVRLLREGGADVRVLSRRRQEADAGVDYVVGDLSTGVGVEAAVAGVGVIVHCATSNKGDVEATQHLVRAATGVGKPHLLYVSIVGLEHIASWGYPKAKLECERLVAESGLPWTILRATQFYDYMLTNLRRLAKLPVVPVPAGFQVKPVDPEDVAARLAELALGEPAGRAPEMAGPVVTSWADLFRDYLGASGKRRWVVPVRIPGTRAVRKGGLLPGPGHTAGTRTWQRFLTEALQQTQAEPTKEVR